MILEFKTDLSIHQIAEQIHKMKSERTFFKDLFDNSPGIRLEGDFLTVFVVNRGITFASFGGHLEETGELSILTGVVHSPHPRRAFEMIFTLVLCVMGFLFLFVEPLVGIVMLIGSFGFLGLASAQYSVVERNTINIIKRALQTESYRVIEK